MFYELVSFHCKYITWKCEFYIKRKVIKMCSFKTVLMILKIKFCVLAQGNYHKVYYYGCAFVYFIFQILKYWNKVWSSFKSCSRISKVWDSENLWQWSHFEIRLSWIGSFRHSTKKKKSSTSSSSNNIWECNAGHYVQI